MHGIKHPFTGAVYENDGDGNVKVTATDGRWGLFGIDGHWIEGALRECDPQLCGWVGGPRVANHRVTAAAKSS